ncbi:ribosome biogenesis protein NOP53 [Amia ocellicauda]|uniref:ribosome biogenesis protein NOP53 n=1 Tax=Amia ocellicauda TaxID=2972642 RepID=UPI003464695D
MAAASRKRRVAAGSDGFLSLNAGLDGTESGIKRRKRVNKNKKKSWLKHSDIQDVEEFLDDVRLQERATGGLVAEKPDDSLFFVDTGDQKEEEEPAVGKTRPLRIDLILQPDSRVPAPKDVLAHQQPNAKKLRRISQRAERLAARGVLPRKQRLMQKRLGGASKRGMRPVPNNHPQRDYYDLWGSSEMSTEDPYYLEQTKKKLVKRPDRLSVKPSSLPAVEVIAPGGSYNPDFYSHQALLLQAHEVEERRQKVEQRLQRQLAVPRESRATEESVMQEQVQGLLEEEEEEEEEEEQNPRASLTTQNTTREKKTEKQRRKEREEKEKARTRLAQREQTDKQQQWFRLRSIKAELQRRAQVTAQRRQRRQERREAEKTQPRRLGRLRFEAPDLEVQLSDELPGSLRQLKPEGSLLKDRFKSLQKRNLIEPRERAKFKLKHKLKYVEKRAFKEITL